MVWARLAHFVQNRQVWGVLGIDEFILDFPAFRAGAGGYCWGILAASGGATFHSRICPLWSYRPSLRLSGPFRRCFQLCRTQQARQATTGKQLQSPP